MSPQNVFFTVGGILLLIVVVVGLFIWKPFEDSLVVSLNTNTAGDASEVAVSHAGGAQTIKEDNHYVSIVRYTGSGFSPLVLVINRGENVRFVNTSNLAMRIEADNTGTTTEPSKYQQATSAGNGGSYELSFVNPGVWLIKDLNTPESKDAMAVVYVK
jgi:hypothetical protein